MHPHWTRQAVPLFGLSLVPLLSLLAFRNALPTGDSANRLEVSVSYAGPETVDAQHPISVLVFDGPDMSGGSNMVGAGSVTGNGKTLSFRGLPSPVYLVAVYDPLGNFTGLSGMIPGSAVGLYAEDGGPEPSAVAVGKRTRLKFQFDDAYRLPGDPDRVVPPSVRDADEGIVEIRTYTVREGMRDQFVEFFEEKTLENQAKAGIRVVGQFRSLENPNQFVWMRAYASQEERTRQLREFYLGPDWIKVQDEAGTMIADTKVMLVAPTAASEVR